MNNKKSLEVGQMLYKLDFNNNVHTYVVLSIDERYGIVTLRIESTGHTQTTYLDTWENFYKTSAIDLFSSRLKYLMDKSLVVKRSIKYLEEDLVFFESEISEVKKLL